MKLLKSLSAYEAYLRSFKASMDGEQIMAFLLQSPDFPRSILNCLFTVEGLLEELDSDGNTTDLRRSSGRTRSDVEFVDLHGFDFDPGRFLEGLEERLRELASEVEHAYIRPTNPVYMHSYEAF